MSEDRVFIGVPVNCEPSLDLLLDDLLKQRFPEGTNLEIIICTNGSLDRTDEIAQMYSEEYPNITYLHVPEQGKARAMNHIKDYLMKKANPEIILFCDGDIRLKAKNLIYKLYHQLKSQEQMLAVTSLFLMKHKPGLSLWQRFVESISFSANTINNYGKSMNGRLYGVRTKAIDHWPDDILFDDAWIAGRIGPDKITLADFGPDFYAPTTFIDTLRRIYRIQKSEYQLKNKYNVDLSEFGSKRNIASLIKLNPLQYASFAIGAGLSIACKMYCRIAGTIGILNYNNGAWTPIISSKPERITES